VRKPQRGQRYGFLGQSKRLAGRIDYRSNALIWKAFCPSAMIAGGTKMSDSLDTALRLQSDLQKNSRGWKAKLEALALDADEAERLVEKIVAPIIEVSPEKALRMWRGELPIEEPDRVLQGLDAAASAFLDSRDAKERRRWTRDLNRAIGSRIAKPYSPEFIPQIDMLDRVVYIEMRNEAVVLPPEWASDHGMALICTSIPHFREMQKGNMAEHPTRRNRQGEPVLVEAAELWRSDHARQCVRDAMYAIGRSRFIQTPNGDLAVNLWSPTRRTKAAADISLFHDHLAFLLPIQEDRERFLDWLAHCEQKPQELPHHGWLMWTEQFGVGRNWLGSVLTRVWQGEVAPSVNISALLGGTFNGVLSCKRFAFVDEIHIGTNNSLFTLAARLRQIMTEEIRVINPKYGKETAEYNTTRWLIFSNHDDALPIPGDDRRFEVVHNPEEVKPEAYYAKLYKALDDPEFIAGVSYFLATRDISGFNAGARPRMTDAKRHIIETSMSHVERDARDLLADWKAAGIKLFCSSDMIAASGADQSQIKSFHHILKRLKVVPLGGRVSFANKMERFFAVDKAAEAALAVDGALEEAKKRIMLERGEGGLMYVAPRQVQGGF
jgi:hypothetical protein